MGLNVLLKRNSSTDENSVKLAAYTIILYISSLFVPFVVVASYQSLVYYSRSQWLFATPFSAYITFMAGMLYAALVLTVYLIFRQRWEGPKFKWTTVFLLIISIPAFILSLTTYYYIDEKGIHNNSLTSLTEEEYGWEEIAKVKIVYRNHQGTTQYYQYQFEKKDGSVITIPYDVKFRENIRRIEDKINKYNILVTDNFKNPIVD